MPETSGNEDLKAKMREALERKQSHDHPDDCRGLQGEGARLRGRRRRAEDAPPQGRWRRVLRAAGQRRRSSGRKIAAATAANTAVAPDRRATVPQEASGSSRASITRPMAVTDGGTRANQATTP